MLGAALVFAVTASLHAQTPQLGVIEFPTSATGKAQEQFITGVLYLHSFEYPLAAAAFQRAERIQPDFVMAYWGEAMTYTHPVWNQQDVAAARAALGRFAPTAGAGRTSRHATRARVPRCRRGLIWRGFQAWSRHCLLAQHATGGSRISN